MKQKEHHDKGRVKLGEFKLNEVVLVRNWRRGVERWIPGRITVTITVRALTYFAVSIKYDFVHVGHLKSARWIQSSSSCEGEEDSNYARNFLSSQAEVKSGVWSPSEPPVNTSEAGGVPDVGDVEEQDTTEVNTRIIIGSRFGGSKSLKDTIVTAPSTEVPKSGEETTTQIHM